MADPAPPEDSEIVAEVTLVGAVGLPTALRRPQGIIDFLKRNVTPKLGAAIALWRVEARLATPLALLLVATLGRWPGALVMGSVMAAYSAAFLSLLDGERALEAMREWAQQRRFFRRHLLPIAERRDRIGTVQRIAAMPLLIIFLGPFWRALTLHAFRVRPLAAYVVSVGGSIPHSLLWTGVVLGGLWEGLIWPFLDAKFF